MPSSTTVSPVNFGYGYRLTQTTEMTFDEEEDDEDLSDLDVEGFDDSEAEPMEEDDVSDQEVDIRALVGKGRNPGQAPPAKKQRKK
jgi:hypothetical protein